MLLDGRNLIDGDGFLGLVIPLVGMDNVYGM